MSTRKIIASVAQKIRDSKHEANGPKIADLYDFETFSFLHYSGLRKATLSVRARWDEKIYLSKICRIASVDTYGESTIVRLVVPIYKSSLIYLVDCVTFDFEFQTKSIVEGLLKVNMLIRLDYDSCQSPVNQKGILLCRSWSIVDGASSQMNPFDFIDLCWLQRLVHANNGQMGVVTQVLVNVMSWLFRHMNMTDQTIISNIFKYQGRLERFVKAPASISSHHAYVHGLLLHTVEVCFCAIVKYNELQQPSTVDLSLLIAASMLHDIGKADEYVERESGRYVLTQSGSLVGHVTKAAMWVHTAAEKSSLETQDRVIRLTHCLTAVSNCDDVGANRSRKLIEAKIVNDADKTSAKKEFLHHQSWLMMSDLVTDYVCCLNA